MKKGTKVALGATGAAAVIIGGGLFIANRFANALAAGVINAAIDAVNDMDPADLADIIDLKEGEVISFTADKEGHLVRDDA